MAAGKWDEVERHAKRLEAYTHDQPLAWPDFMMARGRALASWGRGNRDADLVTELKRLRDVAVGAGMKLAASDLERVVAEATPR